MTLDENIADYLEAQSVGTKGTDIFIGDMPPNITNCIMVKLTGGESPNQYVPIKRLTFQIMVRNSNHKQAKDKAYTIYDLLHDKNDDFTFTAGGVDVMRLDAISFPSMILKDDQGRVYFSNNYLVTIRG